MKNQVPLSIEGLSVTEGRRPLICDLSFQVGAHQFVSLMGENGVGKTCLLEAICGVRKFIGGKVHYWGKPIQKYDSSEFYSKVSWVTSTPESYPAGSKIFELFDFVKSIYPHWNDKFARALCEQFKLSPQKKLSELSLGEHSKIRLVKAISFEPKLLLLDELTANLSPHSKSAVLSALMDLFSRTEMSILYVCHAKEEAVRLSDRILELTPVGLEEKR